MDHRRRIAAEILRERLRQGLDHDRLSAITGIPPAELAAAEQPERPPPSAHDVRLIDYALGAGGRLIAMNTVAQRTSGRRRAGVGPRGPLDVALGPGTSRGDTPCLPDLPPRAGAAAEHLDDIFTAFMRRYDSQTRAEIVTRADQIGQAVHLLIEQGNRACRRDLHRLAGRIAVVRADVAWESARPAGDLLDAAHRHAQLARDRSLAATVKEAQATIAYFDGRPADALAAARAGQCQVSRGPVGARLVAQEARALAAVGQRAAALRALERGYTLTDRLDPAEFGPACLAFDTFHPAEMHYAAAGTLAALGLATLALRYGEEAITALDALGATSLQAMTRVRLASLLLASGRLSLDRACALVDEAVTLSSDRWWSSIDRDITAFLARARPCADAPEVQATVRRVRAWRRSAVP
jgi:tetratricopeptide (TPR) repeat protein